MKFRPITCALIFSSLTACAFFDTPLDEIGSTTALPQGESTSGSAAEPSALPPPLPSPSQDQSQDKQSTAAASSNGTYFIVTSIFEVPEDIPDLSFVHFTDRSKRREKALCEALLNSYQITQPSDVPSTASSIIIWPVEEGATANNCNSMISAHEPLELSRQTAESVKSKGPYALSRSSSAQKQMIYDLSAVSTGDLAGALTEWQQVMNSGAQNWLPVLKAR